MSKGTSDADAAYCVGEFCNHGWKEVLTHMSPYGWGYYGIAFGLGLSVVGAAWGIWLTGSCLVGAAPQATQPRFGAARRSRGLGARPGRHGPARRARGRGKGHTIVTMTARQPERHPETPKLLLGVLGDEIERAPAGGYRPASSVPLLMGLVH